MSRRVAAHRTAPVRNPDSSRALADLAFSRAAGAPLVGGNRVTVLRDAAENYPAWDRAIAAARHTIHVEMYIVHRDRVGRRFIELLAARARDGVTVRVVYDWFGCGWGPALGLFQPLVDAGGQVRAFNRPTIRTVLGWTRRNHRKLITVDGQIAFVSGLCLGVMWEGRSERHQAPWRDTGVEIVGPTAAHADRAFAESWRLTGGTMDVAPLPVEDDATPAGSVAMRLISTEPYTASMLRLDLLVSTLARRTLWITDAYFLGHGPFSEALRRAAHDGVDVRLLLPQGSDVGLSVSASRTLYRTLLEGGVRIFEWNGSMIHAKTAVADGRWARVGSTNLNVISWLGNWELDVSIEDEGIAKQLEAQYLDDLDHSTEIVLEHGPRHTYTKPVKPRARARPSTRRVVRTMTGLSRSIGAAVTGSRQLEDFEFAPLVFFGLLLGAISAAAFWRPALLGWPVALLAGWTAATFVVEACAGWFRRRSE